MRALIVLLLLLSAQAAQFARADELLARIAAQLDRHAVVRADFAQSKRISGLKRLLQTEGRLVFARDAGVLWQIERPYRIGYVLSENKVVEIGPDGSRKVRSANDFPGMAQVARVFRAMLGGNTAALGEYFAIQARGDTSGWSLALAPRQAQMAQFIVGMEIVGGTFVEAISIRESGGDLTRISFRNSSGADALTAAERRQFGFGGE